MSLDHYAQLTAQIDAFSAGITERHSNALRCRLGCTACCRQDLTVGHVEAASILLWLESNPLPPPDPSKTPEDDHPLFDDLAGPAACAFLSAGGGCGIYPVRPAICRSHGLPIKLEDGTLDTCPLNFEGGALDAVPTVDLLDLGTLNKKLAMIEIFFCRQQGVEAGERIALSELRAMVED